jgi:hypothetical protein
MDLVIDALALREKPRLVFVVGFLAGDVGHLTPSPEQVRKNKG